MYIAYGYHSLGLLKVVDGKAGNLKCLTCKASHELFYRWLTPWEIDGYENNTTLKIKSEKVLLMISMGVGTDE